jgi:hypothetical protein
VELKDIKVGERYRWSAYDVTVGGTMLDRNGAISAMHHAEGGDLWGRVHPRDLSPIVRRYTVELRPPKAGERYLNGGMTITAVEDFAADEPRWVIVDGDQ